MNPDTKRSSNIQKEKRIRYTQELILNDIASVDIIKALVDKWGIGDRQAHRYIVEAKKSFVERNEDKIEQKIAYYKQRKLRIIRDMDPGEKKTAAGATAVSRILDSMAKMDGVLIDKVDVTTKGKALPAPEATTVTIIKTTLKLT